MNRQQEPSAAELAFEAFRKEFPLIKVYVEGNQMVYRFTHNDRDLMDGWKILAESIVERLRLPITVTIEKQKMATLPMLLTLTYTENEKQPSEIDH